MEIIAAASTFGQSPPAVDGKYSDIAAAFKTFSDVSAGRANVTADIGLNWSDAYIGELISYPPHYGFGGSIGLNSMKASAFNNMLENTMGLEAVTPLFSDKHFYPTYLAEMRLGGFRDIPFDVGFKVGWLPSFIPMPLFRDFAYDNLQAGFDLRFNVLSTWTGFRISVGGSFNYLKGFLEYSNYRQKWSDDGSGAGQVFDPGGTKFRLTWETTAFNAKVIFEKSFRLLGFTLFGGIIAGYGLGSTGMAFVGDGFSWNGQKYTDMKSAEYKNVEDGMAGKIGNGSEWKIDKIGDDIALSGKISANAVDFHTYEGIAFDFDSDWHIQLALIFDLANLEYGFMFGFRWQQRQF